MKRWLIAMATFALVAAACTAGDSTDTPSVVDTASGASHEPVTLEMWTAWTSKAEIEDFDQVIAAFEEAYPWITVNTVKNVNDTKLLAAINSGTSPTRSFRSARTTWASSVPLAPGKTSRRSSRPPTST